MSKSITAYKTISEVVEIVGLKSKSSQSLPTHTIRFWETKFKQIKPKFFSSNRRYYDKKTIELLAKIKFLLKDEGMKIEGVKRFLNNGYQVHNLDLEPANLGTWHHCDVSDVSAVKTVIAKIASNGKCIDVLVSNAGRHLSATIEDTDEATFDSLFALNVKGAYAAIQSVLPSMKAQQNGAIILIASDQAIIAKNNSFAYNLTKHALASMAKTTAYPISAIANWWMKTSDAKVTNAIRMQNAKAISRALRRACGLLRKAVIPSTKRAPRVP